MQYENEKNKSETLYLLDIECNCCTEVHASYTKCFTKTMNTKFLLFVVVRVFFFTHSSAVVNVGVECINCIEIFPLSDVIMSINMNTLRRGKKKN